MRYSIRVFLLLWVVVVLAACDTPAPEKAETEGSAPADAVVVVGDEPIGMSEIKRKIETLPPQHQARMTTLRGLRDFVDNQATHAAMMQEARETGLAEDPDIVQKVEAYRERLIMQELMAATRDEEFAPAEEELREFFGAREAQFRKDGEARSFAEAREDVMRRFRLQHQRDQHRSFVEGVREKRPVVIDDEVLARLHRQLQDEPAEAAASEE